MKVLVLNCGSSSIKYKLYNMDDESVLAQGGVERIGLDNAFIKVKLPNGEKKQIMHDMPDHKEGVNCVQVSARPGNRRHQGLEGNRRCRTPRSAGW